MRKEGNMKNKTMSMLVVLTMVLAGFMVMNTYDIGIVETAKGTKEVTVHYILSNNGMVNQSSNLTCGEWVTWAFPGNEFTKGDDYIVKVWNGSGLVNLVVDNEEVDNYGNLYIKFRVPGWYELDGNPLGTHNISLWKDESTDVLVSWAETDITIGNLYDVWFEYGGEKVDYLLYGKDYSGFEIHVQNWTGTNLDDDFSTTDLDAVLYHQDGLTEESVSDFDNVGTLPNFLVNDSDISDPNKEVFWWVNVTYNDDPAYTSNVSLPVLLNMTFDVSSDTTWGDTVEINYGHLEDGAGDGMDSYGIRVYAPCNGSYTLAKGSTTAYDGTFSYDISTGSDYSLSAGTWFIGTWNDDDSVPRVNTTDDAPHIPGFITYSSFEVAPRDDVTVRIENDDDLTTGFDQTVNISVKNESWMENKEYENMYVHVTGLTSYNATTGEYDKDDIVQVIDGSAYISWTDSNEKYAYYKFLYHFNDTGTGTIWVSNVGNLTAVMNDTSGDTTRPGESGFYTLKYGNGNLNANMTGTKSLNVVGADSMNLVVAGAMVDSVIVEEGDSPGMGDDRWINGSDSFTFNIYGDSSADRLNSTIDISGCGLDFTIEEDDPSDTEECTAYPGDSVPTPDGQYTVTISPKVAGTLTITATNDTSDESVTKDYTITGLTGSVTTSVGDDLKLTVGTTETITATVTNGQYSEVTLTYFDTDWTKTDSATIVVNNTVGDGTEGEGLNGIFTFVPDTDDIENLGYIVVAAKAGGSNYMYDIIKIEPIYDLEIELVTPTLVNGTPTLTVGLEQDLAFNLLDSSGSDVDSDDPSATVKLIDEDHDEDNALMTWSSDESGDWAIDQSGDEWQIDDMMPWWKGQIVIDGRNNTDGIAHAGNLTLDVDYATFTYSPTAATAGIGTENLTVTVTGVDANGDPLPDGTTIYFWCNDSVDAAVCDSASSGNAVDFKDVDASIDLDEDGMGEFELDKVGDNQTKINATFGDNNPSNGNKTLGEFNIYFPTFALNPDTIYIGQSNMVEITAADHEGNPIEGINLTFISSIPGILSAQPDPVQTNADGIVEMSINPLASGKLNVTIARNMHYEGGQLNWTNAVVTDTVVTATSLQTLKISVSKSPIYEGETLTVTVKSGTTPASGIDVTFGETTAQTDTNGQATFTVADPGVESAVYTITAEKAGYLPAEKSITVIKIYGITIIGPSTAPGTGETFTITALAKGSALAGATISFDSKTYTTGVDGSATLTAPSKEGTYTVKGTYEGYEDVTLDVEITAGGIPGFELLTLIAAIGVAFILLRRRR